MEICMLPIIQIVLYNSILLYRNLRGKLTYSENIKYLHSLLGRRLINKKSIREFNTINKIEIKKK